MMHRSLLFILLATSGISLAQDDLSRILNPVYLPQRSAERSTATNRRPSATTLVISEADFVARVQQALATQMHVEGDLRLSLGRAWTPLRLATTDWQLSVSDLPIGGLAKSFLVRVRISAQERVWFDQQVLLLAQLYKPVLVATRKLERGQPLERTALDVQPMDVLREHKSFLPADSTIDGQELVQSVSEGHPLTSKDIAASPLIRKGAVVDVIANGGGISITTKAIALAAAGLGETVSVRNIDTHRDIRGRVIERNTVQVSF